jgi:hypothetical protein
MKWRDADNVAIENSAQIRRLLCYDFRNNS